ncbi:ABC transporter ATP-binding protein [Candidatus Falkowbacteria bacterium]|nr:ABC transporter ATP-binding protein [Candidatus Falkowbacteria bacterium]MBT4433459.1 ABC transporter ATP-binding protein [Candidatus Falkowbacteria bacterium]
MLKVRNISHNFQIKNKQIPVLEDVSFDIEEQEFVSIIGPSGAGKTTLINILAGYLKPTKGEATLSSKTIKKPGKDRVVISQEEDLFDWMNIYENVKFGVNKNQETVNKYIELVGLKDFANSYPHQLSGGMKKRASLARALAAEPKFILMDEPFGSLDYQTRETIHKEVLNIWQKTKKTALIITHDIEEAIYLSNKIIVFSERPARIKKIIKIPFSYSRKNSIKNSSEFIKIKNEIKDLISNEF